MELICYGFLIDTVCERSYWRYDALIWLAVSAYESVSI